MRVITMFAKASEVAEVCVERGGFRWTNCDVSV